MSLNTSLGTALRISLAMILLFTAFVSPAVSETADTIDPSIPIISIVFPVAGECSFTSTFGDPRGGGTRTHEGEDIMAKKMTPVVAAVDGTIDWLNDGIETSTANGLPYYNLMLRGDDGNDYYYIHLNNDTPGTDDGLGGLLNAYAPGIATGVRVIAGQILGYVGDSGNAENASSHLHFEIHLGGYKNPIDPYPSLRMAQGESLFKDVGVDDWPFQYINNLVKKRVIRGYANGTFKPDGLVTRAEFIKMIVIAMQVETSTAFGGAFPDVTQDHWSWPYVEAAQRTGLINGDAVGRFRPDKPINRAEAAKIISKVRGAVAGNPSDIAFFDVTESFWGYASIMTAKNSGAISGYPNGTFKPLNPTNRAEAAKIIYMVCK